MGRCVNSRNLGTNPPTTRKAAPVATTRWRLRGGSPGSGHLLLLAIFNNATVEFVQLNDSCPTAHQRRYRQPSLFSIFRLDDGPSAVDASFASPVKIPEIALRVEHFDQIKAFLGCVRCLDQVAIHVFLLLRNIDAPLVTISVNHSRPTGS